jgi:hypothetical protein
MLAFGLCLALAIWALLATDQDANAEGSAMTDVTREAAPGHVAERYKQLFDNLLIANPIDGQAVELEDLVAEDFKVTGEDQHVWIVRHDPLTGPIVQARVAKSGGLVDFDRIELAVE